MKESLKKLNESAVICTADFEDEAAETALFPDRETAEKYMMEEWTEYLTEEMKEAPETVDMDHTVCEQSYAVIAWKDGTHKTWEVTDSFYGWSQKNMQIPLNTIFQKNIIPNFTDLLGEKFLEVFMEDDNTTREISKSIQNVFGECVTERDYEIADKMLIAICGYSFQSLLEMIEEDKVEENLKKRKEV